MKLGYTILYVQNVQETVSFYEKAFGLKCRFIHESGAYAEMETGQTALAFVGETLAKMTLTFRPNRKESEPAGNEIALVTEDVEMKFYDAVKAGAIPVAPPVKKPWGQTVSYVKDMNGCLVEICSPLA